MLLGKYSIVGVLSLGPTGVISRERETLRGGTQVQVESDRRAMA